MTKWTDRAYTGHEQISELDGLVHMNARLYDNQIGRFLSADTMIPTPSDSRCYNRYSYVKNNPLMYTDPTGHWSLGGFLRSVGNTIKNNIKTIAAIAIGAVIAIYAPVLLGAYISNAFGVAVATGALAGFASGAIMTGTVKGALKGAVFGAISGGVSFGIGSAFSNAGLSHGANIFQNGKVGMQVLRAGAHGLSRGIISVARGGTFKSGFASGFTSSFLSPGNTLGGNNGGGFTLRTSIASIVGGTASKLGGGKFSNGAVSGAFVHMFNAEWRFSVSLSGGAGKGETAEMGTTIAHDSNKPWYTGWSIGVFTTAGIGGYAGADGGGEINVGWSDNNHVKDIGGNGTIVGASADVAGFVNVGYESTLSQTGAAPLHNVSAGLYGNPFVPGEAHVFASSTSVDFVMEW